MDKRCLGKKRVITNSLAEFYWQNAGFIDMVDLEFMGGYAVSANRLDERSSWHGYGYRS